MQVCLRVCCHNASLSQLLQELIDWAFDKPQPASNADASAPSDPQKDTRWGLAEHNCAPNQPLPALCSCKDGNVMRVTPNTGASLQLRSAVTSRRAWALVGMTSMSLLYFTFTCFCFCFCFLSLHHLLISALLLRSAAVGDIMPPHGFILCSTGSTRDDKGFMRRLRSQDFMRQPWGRKHPSSDQPPSLHVQASSLCFPPSHSQGSSNC